MLSVNTFSANSLNINTAWNLVLLASPSTHFLQRTYTLAAFHYHERPLNAEQWGQFDHRFLSLQYSDGPQRKAEQWVLLNLQGCKTDHLSTCYIKWLLIISARAILNLRIKREPHFLLHSFEVVTLGRRVFKKQSMPSSVGQHWL